MREHRNREVNGTEEAVPTEEWKPVDQGEEANPIGKEKWWCFVCSVCVCVCIYMPVLICLLGSLRVSVSECACVSVCLSDHNISRSFVTMLS